MNKPPKIIFLDQNKWIDLTHAMVDANDHSPLRNLGFKARDAIMHGEMLFPLTANLIIETYKMKDAENRGRIAEIQAKFSQGYVYRDRATRLGIEIANFVRQTSGLEMRPIRPLWWLSKYFIEAFIDIPSAVSKFGLQPDQLEGIRADPKYALYHWLATAPGEEQLQAMSAFNAGTDALIDRIMSRVTLLKGEKFAMRRRAYSANLFVSEAFRILDIAHSMGVTWSEVSDIGASNLKRLMKDVASYHAEIELVARIESLDRSIVRNDLRDMQAYVSAIPYADVVVGENLFVNMAKQAGLDKKFGCRLTTNLSDLAEYF